MVATLEFIQSRSSAKLRHKTDQRLGQQPALIEIGNQPGERMVGTPHHDPMANPVPPFPTRHIADRPA